VIKMVWNDEELSLDDMDEYEKNEYKIRKIKSNDYFNLNKMENRKNRYIRIQKSMGNDNIKLAPSDEDFVNNYTVHRIVFENLLTELGHPPEGNDRSLSIPFDGKMRPVWAPNGYGKTFAFKILSFLNVNAKDIWNPTVEDTVKSYWYDFIKKCNDYLYPKKETFSGYQEPGNIFTSLINEDFNLEHDNLIKKHLIPFVEMKIRLVGTKKGFNGEGIKQVVDISIKPEWDHFKLNVIYNIPDNFAVIRKKFWTAESLKSPYYNAYPDKELEEILLNTKINSEGSFYQPNFISNSFKFPQAFVEFSDMYPDFIELYNCQECGQVVSYSHGKCSECAYNLDLDNYYDTDYQDPINLIEESIRSNLFLFSSFFIKYREDGNNTEFTEVRNLLNHQELELIAKLLDIDEMDESEKNNLLLDFIILSEKRPNFKALDKIYGSTIYPPFEKQGGSDFGVICVLLDLLINGVYNQNHDFVSKESGSRVHNHLFQRFNSYFQISSISWRTFDVLLRENESNCIEDESIIEAVRSLSTIYFEIPSLVNYSSESSLNSSQEKLKNMLSVIKNEFVEINLDYPRSQYSELWCQYSTPVGTVANFPYSLHEFLQIINERLGSLDNFFRVLGIPCSLSYDNLLNMMNNGMTFLEEEQVYTYTGTNEVYVLDFTRPEIAKLTMLIWNFSEIYSNINRTLDQGDLTAWSAQCRFFSFDKPLKFSDPQNDIDINEKHLSFGQRSVVVTESCLGLSVFMDPKQGLQNQGQFAEFPAISNLKICYIFDEPEIGRSEYWVNLIARRIKSTCENLDGEKSFMIVSHRESLLRSFNFENKYYVMQPQSPSTEEE
tara:strand:- start:1613 stop:4111 length:2499 start_codon:yes stop_codon:yes gene_type:complete